MFTAGKHDIEVYFYVLNLNIVFAKLHFERLPQNWTNPKWPPWNHENLLIVISLLLDTIQTYNKIKHLFIRFREQGLHLYHYLVTKM